jgi:hypothetical protein
MTKEDYQAEAASDMNDGLKSGHARYCASTENSLS